MLLSNRSRCFCLGLVMIGCLLVDPCLAGNKFETIGGGVVGSSGIKLQHLRVIGIGAGIFFLVCAVLSATVARGNPLTLNYSLWKQSSAVLLALSLISFGFVVFT